MKKTIIAAIVSISIVLFTVMSSPASSLFIGRLVAQLTSPATASAASITGEALFYGLIFVTDGTNNITVNVYDAGSATGTKLVPTDLVILGGARVFTLSFDPGIKVNNGIYVDVSVAGGGTCSYQVMYDK